MQVGFFHAFRRMLTLSGWQSPQRLAYFRRKAKSRKGLASPVVSYFWSLTVSIFMAHRRHKPNYLLSIISVALVLLLLGLFGLMIVSTQSLVSYYQDHVEISVEVADSTANSARQLLQNRLTSAPYVQPNTLRFISKEEGIQMMQATFGSDFLTEGMDNPLLDVYRFQVQAAYITPQQLADIKQQLEALPQVDYVFYEATRIAGIQRNVWRISAILIIVAIAFLLVAYTLIHNTVRLALYSNRFIIKNMQLVGAKPQFISKSYLQKSIINGLYSTLIAWVGLGGTIGLIVRFFPDVRAYLPIGPIAIVALILLVFGALVSYISTRISIQKFLSLPVDELY